MKIQEPRRIYFGREISEILTIEDIVELKNHENCHLALIRLWTISLIKLHLSGNCPLEISIKQVTILSKCSIIARRQIWFYEQGHRNYGEYLKIFRRRSL